jgi:hypothetical protein
VTTDALDPTSGATADPTVTTSADATTGPGPTTVTDPTTTTDPSTTTTTDPTGEPPPLDCEVVPPAALTAGELPATFRRVALARVFQKDKWTLPHADTYPAGAYTPRISYACDVIARLAPTHVSGLLRLDEAAISEEQRTTFKCIRKCVRERVGPNVRFDVVLNALHYTDPALYTQEEGATALKARLETIQAELAPDLYFFDFFNVPYDSDKKDCQSQEDVDCEKVYNAGALQAGIKWIHDHGQLVGGNVWGLDLPPGSDFAALDNFDRSDMVEGLEYIQKQIDAFGDKVPVMMHIENNPQKVGSKGLDWLFGTHEYRLGVLDKHATKQAIGYCYMFPVFFPLRIEGEQRLAYDAATDGDMIDKMLGYLGTIECKP